MTALREPRTVAAATELCERFAELDGQIATIAEGRQADIAAVNARADTAANDLIAERDTLAAKLGAWWGKGGREQALEGQGKAKSVELGGCIVGSKAGRATLQVAGSEDELIDQIKGERWAKPFVRVKTSLDKAQVLKDIDGRHSVKLAELGFSKAEGVDQFFVKRAEQGQTRG
tara:strand:+ start:8165 stop:8686 length:522 start_codon:yes stop_codon:yes gene_type:complete